MLFLWLLMFRRVGEEERPAGVRPDHVPIRRRVQRRPLAAQVCLSVPGMR